MLYLLFTITYNSFFKFYLNEDSYTQLLLDWVVCLTTASDSKSCILHLPGFIYRYIGLISTAATGFVSFLVYAIDINTFNIWRESTPVRYILRKCGVSSSGSSSSSTNKSNSRRSRGQSLGPKMNHRMSILQTQNSSTDSQSSNITTPDTQGSTVLSIAASGDSIDSTPRNASEQQT
ncbi:hypothetical protein CYY_010087 [Polysphondylium violaceum]|uniref:Uncharacterized protein n=1 Tax=Polysphondylium violaceum TaxID=133409 RepID=A0A8J4PL63_9MYCE|nr:hypothetical protein CYY_010087 [Polysphondylium violaceum]